MANSLIVGIAAALALLAGCSNTELDEAEKNLARWKQRGPASYVYVVEHPCFCDFSGPVRVVVEDGRVASALTVEDEPVESAKTMTELLEEVVQQADQRYTELEASYDPELGYLTSLSIDTDSDTSDGGSSTKVSCFGEGTGDDVCPI